MAAYYNEFDPYAAQWLRNLIAAGHIAPGDVDERSIEDVAPSDLMGYSQCHFFAGIGIWSDALRLAGISDDTPIWTGSCPCQPFSSAGQGKGFADERHLWPAFFHLIEQCQPAIVFGEQVAGKDAESWIDLVQVDLEALDYAFGAIPFPSSSVGAPHIRDRLYWVANSPDSRWGRPHVFFSVGNEAVLGGEKEFRRCGDFRGLAVSHLDRREKSRLSIRPRRPEQTEMVELRRSEAHKSAGPANGFWGDADWILCRDGKWRPVESGTFPLVARDSSTLGRLRAYGNAINAIQAQIFIEAVMDCCNVEGRAEA